MPLDMNLPTIASEDENSGSFHESSFDDFHSSNFSPLDRPSEKVKSVEIGIPRKEIEDILYETSLTICEFYRQSIQLDDAINSKSAIKKYSKKSELSTEKLQEALHRKLNESISFVESIDDQQIRFLRLINFTDAVIEEATDIDTLQQIWFGDYFEVQRLDALRALHRHLKSILDKLNLKSMVKSIHSRE